MFPPASGAARRPPAVVIGPAWGARARGHAAHKSTANANGGRKALLRSFTCICLAEKDLSIRGTGSAGRAPAPVCMAMLSAGNTPGDPKAADEGNSI